MKLNAIILWIISSLALGLGMCSAVSVALLRDHFRSLDDRIERLEETPHEHSHDFGAAPHEHAAEPRSPQWPKVRAAYIKLHPACECCGSVEQLEVHHVVSFSHDKTKELDLGNLITLCHHHHFVLAHLCNFKLENPHIREDAALLKKRTEEARAELASRKTSMLPRGTYALAA